MSFLRRTTLNPRLLFSLQQPVLRSPRCLLATEAAATARHQWAPSSALNLSEAAMQRLQALRTKENNPRLALRVTVESGGCHGYQYHMDIQELPQEQEQQQQPAEAHEFADEPDELISPPDNAPAGSLPFLVTDPMSLKLTRGATVHFATELIGSTFRIEDNPQAKGAGCGCGVSWELKDDVEL